MTPARAVLVVGILCASLHLAAQDSGVGVLSPPRPPVAPKPPQGSIAGHVYLADTRGPARGARLMVVSLSELGLGGNETSGGDGQPHMGITALDGSFFLPHVAPGEYVVLAFAAGYLSPLDGIVIPRGADAASQPDIKAIAKKLLETAPTVHVNGPESARIDIELERGAALSGKVIYSDGSPAGQLQISVQKSGDLKPGAEDAMDIGVLMRTLYLQQRPSTDDQGHFRIAGIAPGSYLLGVAQTFEASANFGEDMLAMLSPGTKQPATLMTYSGNTLHRKDAKVYDLKAGDSLDGIEITLPLNGLHFIHGVVAGKDGMPLNYGSLNLTDASDSTITFHTIVDTDGQFRFTGIPEGTYTLKTNNGRIFENPPNADFSEEMIQSQQQQFKPLRAFADTEVPVVVQTMDLESFSVTLADTKVPESPRRFQVPPPNPPIAPGQP